MVKITVAVILSPILLLSQNKQSINKGAIQKDTHTKGEEEVRQDADKGEAECQCVQTSAT